MYDIQNYTGSRQIPFVHQKLNIDIDGNIFDENGISITLEEFNAQTNLSITDKVALAALTYQRFNWPPVYWKKVKALRTIDGFQTPETIVLGIDEPIESMEYPGYYLIPYFSNYVISENGRLIKKSTGQEIQASAGNLGYYTFRMTNDGGQTQNQLRHRILCYAFKPYPSNVEQLDVNHIDGVPGSDQLTNLEWISRSGNMMHAYDNGLRNDNLPVQIKNIETGMIFIFPSCSAAGRELKVTETTISNRAKTNGYKAYDGFQFRYHPNSEPWPEFERLEGKFLVEFPNGTTLKCGSREAAMHAGVTRTSLLRMLREGRCYGTTPNKITRTN
jgi:hypothetical protein